MNRLRDLRAAVLVAAPTVACGAALVAGGLLLISGATPTDPGRLTLLQRFAPNLLIDVSHFSSSLIGLVLVLLAFGLKRRLDAAWTATVVLVLAAAALALFKGLNVEEIAVLALVAAALVPLRPAFDRHAGLTRIELTPGWLFSALAALVGAALLGLWLFENRAESNVPFWQVLADADQARAVRAVAGAGVLLLGIGLWRLLASPSRPAVVGEADPDFARVEAILATSEATAPEANLALLGDKRFLFSASGRSFLMFGVRGRSWVALGAPVGLHAERMELLWRFREMADARGVRPSVYDIGPDDLPDMVELGFALQKIGEAAAVSLDTFSTTGRRREVLRRNHRKAAEAGATFEVAPVEALPVLLPELRRVSDAWLAGQPGGEKGFSLGGFHEPYVAKFPCAVVRWQGRIVAFATLWSSSDHTAFSMDLMRYADDGPKNVMDFLFVELLGWGKANGYRVFDFGMAPLAGLTNRPLSPLFNRIGRAVFERGEAFYNFQGVRRYKDKYDPVWEPRYVAAPWRWAIPLVLADVGLMSSPGSPRLPRLPARRPEPALPQSAAAT